VASGKQRARVAAPKHGRGAALSPNGKLLATHLEGTKHMVLWNTATGKEFKRFAHDGFNWSCAFSADGRILAVGYSSAAHLYVFDPERLQLPGETSLGK
jgi:WD40 repeat protein